MNNWEMSFGSCRGKKIWIKGYKKIGYIKDINGNNLAEAKQLASIELNVIDKEYKIVWIIEDDGKEKEIKLSKEQESELMQLAYNFAKDNKYIDKVLKRYK